MLYLLQLSIAPYVGILGSRANLALVLAVALTLGGEVKAPAIGFACGLFYDLSRAAGTKSTTPAGGVVRNAATAARRGIAHDPVKPA